MAKSLHTATAFAVAIAGAAATVQAQSSYVLTSRGQSSGWTVRAFRGLSSTPFATGSTGLASSFPYTQLYDFSGDGTPELIFGSSQGSSVSITGDSANATFNENLPGIFGLSSLTVLPTQISLTFSPSMPGIPSQTFNHPFDPPGDPLPSGPIDHVGNTLILDMDGDGILDSLSYDDASFNIKILNGATNLTTSIFPGFASAPLAGSVSLFAWTPAPIPEPASLSLLTLALPLLLRRERR